MNPFLANPGSATACGVWEWSPRSWTHSNNNIATMRESKAPNIFCSVGISGGGCPLVSFPTPLMISIAIVSSIAILLLDTYRGRNFRYRPALRLGVAKWLAAATDKMCTLASFYPPASAEYTIIFMCWTACRPIHWSEHYFCDSVT